MDKAQLARRVVVPVVLGLALTATAAGPALAGTATGSATAKVTSVGRLGPLTDLVIERLLVGDEVAAAKFGTGSPIDDPVREQQELAAIRQSATALGIDPDAAAAFFQQQITASKVVQQGLFDRWTAHPDQAPTTRPDLTQIRDRLDQLTTELLQQLVAQRGLLATGLPCRISLTVADSTGAAFDHLDALHRKALATAQSATCPA